MSSSESSSPYSLHWTKKVSYAALATLALSFPILTFCVFNDSIKLDRTLASHILSAIFASCVYIAFLVPFLGNTNTSADQSKLRNGRSVSRENTNNNNGDEGDPSTILEGVVISWTCFSCTIHLSWELIWLLFTDKIRQSRNSPWAYPWWSYIDGGDARYNANEMSTLVYCLEVCSVINGVVGLFALYYYHASTTFAVHYQKGGKKVVEPTKTISKINKFNFSLSMVLFTAFSVYHLASCFIYFLSESVCEGFKNVNTDSWFDLYVKFFLVNSPWLVFPWFVLKFVVERLVSYY